MTGAILALLWSLGVGLVWVAGLGMVQGCATDPPPPEITITPWCGNVGCDASDHAPSCDGTGFCDCDGLVCAVPKCADLSGSPHTILTGPDGAPGCDQSLCYWKGELCDQSDPDLYNATVPGPSPNIRPTKDPSRGDP